MDRIVVVGTGTDIGKTHVTCALLGAARAAGWATSAFKPVATGVLDRCEDADRHARALRAEYVEPVFSYLPAVSPHRAARMADRAIDLEAIRARADELANGKKVQLVETAGGLFTPLSPMTNNADLVRALAPCSVVLVALDRLGVLHDLGAAMAAARSMGLPRPHIVLSAPSSADESTGTNADEIAAVGLGRVVAVFPRNEPHAEVSLAAAQQTWSALGLG